LSEPELRGVVKSIVDGLCYLRKKLVIHRDMNPSNILIGEDWRVKIADFGHAVRVVSETSTVTYRCATSELGYLSPELAAHRPHGFPTDIWSLGAVVITCMRGDHAFGASSPEEINKKIARADYSVPSFVSRELRNLISSLLKVIPRERISLHGISSHPFMNSSL
ncbi:kinase-like domain-containing protein, partial [Irpex rosettiformis]